MDRKNSIQTFEKFFISPVVGYNFPNVSNIFLTGGLEVWRFETVPKYSGSVLCIKSFRRRQQNTELLNPIIQFSLKFEFDFCTSGKYSPSAFRLHSRASNHFLFLIFSYLSFCWLGVRCSMKLLLMQYHDVNVL